MKKIKATMFMEWFIFRWRRNHNHTFRITKVSASVWRD